MVSIQLLKAVLNLFEAVPIAAVVRRLAEWLTRKRDQLLADCSFLCGLTGLVYRHFRVLDGREANRDFLSMRNAIFDTDQVAGSSDVFFFTCVFSSQVRTAYCRFYFKRSKWVEEVAILKTSSSSGSVPTEQGWQHAIARG